MMTEHLQATKDVSSGTLYQVRLKVNMLEIGVFLLETDGNWYWYADDNVTGYPWYVLKELGEMLEEINSKVVEYSE